MEKSKSLIFLLVLWFSELDLFAQNRYMVFFTDKDSSEYTLDRPLEFLSQRALDRRMKNDVSLTEQDLPVNATYVAGIEAEGADVFFTTKWMNGALAQIHTSDTADVNALDYVSHIEYIAKGVKLSDEQVLYTIPETFLEPVSVSAGTEIQLAMIGADNMQVDGYTGEGIFIAVFDIGFPGVNEYKPFEHIFSEGRLAASKDFVRNSGNVFQYNDHGSSVLSCIAAKYGDMVSGTAPDASFVLCITEDGTSEYRIEEYNWLLAAEYADSIGVDVINASLGYTTFPNDSTMDYTYKDMDGKTTVVARAAKIIAEKGVVVVVSAGNRVSWDYVSSPADVEDILAIGSVTNMASKSNFSSIGPTADGRIKPDVVAIGSSATIFRMISGNGEITMGNGTSFASPQIAGLAVGIIQANPTWTSEQVINAIKFSGSNWEEPDNLIGYGIPNYNFAVQGENAVLSVMDILSEKIKVYPNPFSNEVISIDFEGTSIRHTLEVSIINTQGIELFSNRIAGKDLPEELKIDFSSTEKGIYFLILRSRKFEKIVKLIKI